MIREAMPKKIDISHKTIFFLTGFLALLWALFLIRDLILILFICIIFVSAIGPIVDHLMKWKLPKPLAISVVYVLVIGGFVAILTLGLTPITIQTSSFMQRLSDSFSNLAVSYHIDQGALRAQIPNLSGNILTFTLDLFQSFITAVLIAVITFYMLLDKDKLEDRFSGLFGTKQPKMRNLLKKIEVKLGAWLRGQLLLSVIVAALIYAGLLVLGVQYALPLAIISGLLEVVPIVGPIISAIPGILIALVTSPILALVVALVYLVVQQIESHVIIPQVMKRAVGLNPLIVILAIAVGSRILGVAGALLAVPITVVGQIIADDYLNGEEVIP